MHTNGHITKENISSRFFLSCFTGYRLLISKAKLLYILYILMSKLPGNFTLSKVEVVVHGTRVYA